MLVYLFNYENLLVNDNIYINDERITQIVKKQMHKNSSKYYQIFHLVVTKED